MMQGRYDIKVFSPPACRWKRIANKLLAKTGVRGRFFGMLRYKRSITNLITNEGMTDLFSVMFNNGFQPDNFYIGLIDNDSFSGTVPVSVTDTALGIWTVGGSPGANAWAENISYSEGTRQIWECSLSTTVGNISGNVVFTINGQATIAGVFLVRDQSGKGETLGKIFSESVYNQTGSPYMLPFTVFDNDLFQITYTLLLTSTL
jgi:hypothetical protein